MHTYILATDRPWGKRVYDEVIQAYGGDWRLIEDAIFLAPELETCQPRYVFFLYWSPFVPREVFTQYECIGFHLTPLPEGRGGSPLQHLIVEGKTETIVTAFRVQEGLDSGPIYCQEPMSLDGLAEEIYIRAARIGAAMIQHIIANEPTPKPQHGGVVHLNRRRTPEQSEMPLCHSLGDVWNHIRMLDAEGYPRAFLEHAGYRYTFSRPALRDGRIVADVEIRRWGRAQ